MTLWFVFIGVGVILMWDFMGKWGGEFRRKEDEEKRRKSNVGGRRVKLSAINAIFQLNKGSQRIRAYPAS